jgi:hypothetical protein
MYIWLSGSWLLGSGSGLFKRLGVCQNTLSINLIHFWTVRITLVLNMLNK